MNETILYYIHDVIGMGYRRHERNYKKLKTHSSHSKTETGKLLHRSTVCINLRILIRISLIKSAKNKNIQRGPEKRYSYKKSIVLKAARLKEQPNHWK